MAAGSIPDLVARLSSGDEAAQCTAAHALKELAVRRTADRSAIVAAGGVDALLQRMRSTSLHVQVAAAMALCALTLEPAAAAAVLASRVLPCLVALLQAGARVPGAAGEYLFTHMAVGLSRFAHADGAAVALVDAGVLPALLPALESGEPRLQHAAAGVLANLAFCAELGEQLVPAVPLLARCLSEADAKVQQAAATALGNVSKSAAVHSAVLGAGSVPLLLQCMQSSTECLALAALAAVGNLCNNDGECSRAVVAAGGVPSLLALLSSHVADVAVRVLDCLAHACPEACVAIEDVGGVPMLMQLVSTRAGAAEGAACLVGRLAELSPQLRSAFQAAGAQAAIGQLLLSYGIPDDELARMYDTVGEELRLERAGLGSPPPSAAAAEGAEEPAEEVEEAAAAAALPAEPATPHAAEAAGSSTPLPHQPSQPASVQIAAPNPHKICAAPGCGATRGLRLCGGCGTVRYCSEACSHAHWREHRAECRRLQAEQQKAGQWLRCLQVRSSSCRFCPWPPFFCHLLVGPLAAVHSIDSANRTTSGLGGLRRCKGRKTTGFVFWKARGWVAVRPSWLAITIPQTAWCASAPVPRCHVMPPPALMQQSSASGRDGVGGGVEAHLSCPVWRPAPQARGMGLRCWAAHSRGRPRAPHTWPRRSGWRPPP